MNFQAASLLKGKLLKKGFRLFLRNDLLKVVSSTGLATALRIASQFIITKILAVVGGPVSIALFGQLTNVANVAQAIGSGGIAVGVTKYLAEYQGDQKRLNKVIGNAYKLTFLCSIICSVVVAILYKKIGLYVFRDAGYNFVILAIALTLLLFTFNSLFIAIINGLRHFRLFFIINISTSVVNLILTLVFIQIWGITGAFLSFVLSPALVFFISFFLLRKHALVKLDYFKGTFDKEIMRKLGHFSLMALNNAIVAAVSQMAIRHIITENISPQQAGIWDAMNRLSSAYLLLLTTSIQVYYLPVLSSIKNPRFVWKEIMKTEKIILPILLVVFTLIYLSRGLIVSILFTEEFSLMKDVLLFQLFGDVIKIGSWIIAYTMYAKAMTKSLIISDNCFTLFYIFLIYLLIGNYQLHAVYYGYIINNFIYFAFVFFYIRRHLLKAATNTFPNEADYATTNNR